MKAKKDLLKVKGLNWRRCDDGHKEILYREMVCPFCEFRLMVRYEIEDCYDNLFKEENKIPLMKGYVPRQLL